MVCYWNKKGQTKGIPYKYRILDFPFSFLLLFQFKSIQKTWPSCLLFQDSLDPHLNLVQNQLFSMNHNTMKKGREEQFTFNWFLHDPLLHWSVSRNLHTLSSLRLISMIWELKTTSSLLGLTKKMNRRKLPFGIQFQPLHPHPHQIKQRAYFLTIITFLDFFVTLSNKSWIHLQALFSYYPSPIYLSVYNDLFHFTINIMYSLFFKLYNYSYEHRHTKISRFVM